MSPASLTQLDSLRVEQSKPIVRQEEEEDEDEVGVHEKRRLDNPHKCYNVIINAGGSTNFKNIDYDSGGGGEEGARGVSVNCDKIRSSVVLDMRHSIKGDDICDNDLILSVGGGSKGIGDIHRSQLHKATARKALLSQCLINAVIMTIVTSGGMPIGFSAILLPQLQSPNSTLPTDDSWASWIASVHSTAAPMGAILAGPIMDQWGRRTTLHLALLPMISGWSFMSLAPNHVFLVVGRLLAGFAVGMIAGPSQVFIGEISEPSLRGLFSSMPSASYALGILLVYAAGSKLHWRFVAGLGTVIPMLAAFALFFVPESPVWLVNKNRPEEAKKCLLLLRGGNVSKVNYELNTLIGHSRMEKDKERQAKLDQEETYCGPIPRWWEIMTRPQVFKPFFIILTFCTLQILSGSYVSIFYGVTLIASASGRSTRDFDCLKNAVMTALVRFVVSIVTSMCLLKLGRRKIGIISGIGTALACFSLVVFLYVKGEATGPDGMSDRDTYVVSGFIMTYVAMNTFGIFSLPGLMIGEVLPSNVRGRVSGVLLMLINLMIFSTTKLYPSVAAVLGSIGVFTAFTIVSIIITIFVYLFLPETRDRPLTQIEEYFIQGKNVIWQNRDKDLIKRRRNSLP